MEKNPITTYWPQIVTAAVIVGSGYLSIYRLDQAEAQIRQIETELKGAIKKEHDQNQEAIRGIRDALGTIQLDMAVVCTELVRERGGNPMIECRTTGGR